MAGCTAYSGGGSRGDPIRKCTRPAVQDGLCKPHLAGRKRREANEAKWQQQAQQRRDFVDKLNLVVAEFRQSHGVELGLDYFNDYTGRFVITEADLRKLVAR